MTQNDSNKQSFTPLENPAIDGGDETYNIVPYRKAGVNAPSFLTGFTLIEIIACVAIIGIALVAILGMFSMGSRGNVLNQDRVIACNLLHRKLEEIKCKSFGVDVTDSNGEEISLNNKDYVLYISQTTPYDGNTYLKKIDVRIQWATQFGGTNEESVFSLVSIH